MTTSSEASQLGTKEGSADHAEYRPNDTVGSQPAASVGYQIQLDTIRAGFDRRTCWVHARAGIIPGTPPAVVLTMQKLLLTGSDVFYALNEIRTDDLGQTWSEPVEHAETLGRREEPGGVMVTEWMQTTGPNPRDYRIPMKYGSDNAVFAARIRWSKPNRGNGVK